MITCIKDLIPAPDNGNDAVSMFLTVSPSTIIVGANSVPSASAIDIRAWMKKGDGEPVPYSGIIQLDIHSVTGTVITRVEQGHSFSLRSVHIPFPTVSYIDVSLKDRETGKVVASTVTVGFVHDGTPGGKGDKGDDAEFYTIACSDCIPEGTTSIPIEVVHHKGLSSSLVNLDDLSYLGLTLTGTNISFNKIDYEMVITGGAQVGVDYCVYLKEGYKTLASKPITVAPVPKSRYTWIKYATTVGSDGYPASMYDTPKADGSTMYMGVAYNKDTEEESDDVHDYTWARIKGADGTSFNPKGKAYGHYSSWSAFTQAQLQEKKEYLVDGGSLAQVGWKDGSELKHSDAASGDAYVLESTMELWMANNSGVWVNLGKIQGAQGPTGPRGPKGEDSASYYMVVTPTQITVTPIAPSSSTIAVKIFKATGTAAPQLYQGSVTVVFRQRNGSVTYASYAGKSSFSVDIGASNMFQNLDTVDLNLFVGGQHMQTVTVSVMQKINRIPIPEGVYDAGKTYVCTISKTPLVLQGTSYYYLQDEGSFQGVDPATSAIEGGAWAKADSFQMVIAEMLFANFGKLASAVFAGDFMLSQYGNHGNSSDYTQFSPATAWESMVWKPNFMIDFLNGELMAGCGAVRMRKDGSGQLAGGRISWDASGNAAYDGSLKVKALEYTEGELAEDGFIGGKWTYHIDMQNKPGNMFRLPLGDRLLLPKAAEHVGLELNIFGLRLTRVYEQFCPIVPQENEYIYFPGRTEKFIDFQLQSGNVKIQAIRTSSGDAHWIVTGYIGIGAGHILGGTAYTINSGLNIYN